MAREKIHSLKMCVAQLGEARHRVKRGKNVCQSASQVVDSPTTLCAPNTPYNNKISCELAPRSIGGLTTRQVGHGGRLQELLWGVAEMGCRPEGTVP